MRYETSGDKMDAMNKAFKLGVQDEMEERKAKSGKELIQILNINEYRKGDIRILKSSYQAGKFHVSCQ